MQIGGDAVVSGLLEILQDHNTPKQGRFQAVVVLKQIKDTTAVQDSYEHYNKMSTARYRDYQLRLLESWEVPLLFHNCEKPYKMRISKYVPLQPFL